MAWFGSILTSGTLAYALHAGLLMPGTLSADIAWIALAAAATFMICAGESSA